MVSKRVAHLGAYDTNIGDNIALYNVRKYLEKQLDSNVEWTKVELKDFYEKSMDKQYCITRMKEISDNHDMLIIGGGGLIQQQKPKYPNRFNLPFYKEELDVIDIPIVCLSVGFNVFRRPKMTRDADNTNGVLFEECEEMSSVFLENLLLLIEKSSFFSFRNDGSLEKIMPYFEDYFKTSSTFKKLPKDIPITPDPGLIFDKEQERKNTLQNGVLQVAFNGNPEIMSGRFKANFLNLAIMGEIQDALDLEVFPHCGKDYRFTRPLQNVGNSLRVNGQIEQHYRTIPKYQKLFYQGTLSEEDYILPQDEFLKNVDYNNFNKIIDRYFQYDYSIAMRGHGQMIAMGLNIPHISLSTQPKVYHFGVDNGFENYTLDVVKDTSPNDFFLDSYTQEIIDMTERLRSDKEYLLTWYEKRDTFIAQCKKDFSWACGAVKELLES